MERQTTTVHHPDCPDVPDHEVIEAMRRFGGGFVKALAEAASRADNQNLARIKATWPEYWAQYSDMAARSKGHP